jgi:hypothetical protein
MKQQKVVYTGLTLPLGLVSGFVYDIEIIKTERSYLVQAVYNHTENKKCDIYCPYSSLKSVKYSWGLPDDLEVTE